jgi:uncharacterized Zn finger protein
MTKGIKYKCKCCGEHEAVIVDSGESFDGGDDWYDMLCRACGRSYRTWVEYD